MNVRIKPLILLHLVFISSSLNAQNNTWRYYFKRPASIWEESIPLGNGRIGMMPWGDINEDKIILNEISLWSGNKQDADNPDAYKYLDEIRRLLFEGKNAEAQQLMYKTFTCKGIGSEDTNSYGSFQVFGNLNIEFTYPNSKDPIANYRRTLDMNKALSENTFRRGNITYNREYFTSFSDDIGVIRYSADKPNSLNLKINLSRDENFETSAKGNILSIYGQLKDDVQNNGMKYFGQIKVLNKDGSIITNSKDIEIKNASEVILLVSLGTSYNKNTPKEQTSRLLNSAGNNFNKLKSRHITKYQKLFNRVDITLAKNKNSDLPINERLIAFAKDKTDYDLVALYMQYGRYLLISSTRVGGLPPNLQGLWAPQIQPPWSADYHLNINLQMNLWGAEIGNLPELQLPLIEYTKSLVDPGQKTAQIYYNSRGWVTHILGNVWQWTSPGEHPSWGATNTSGAWLCQHLWEHYLYTMDLEYLRSVYPTMRGAALFFEDMLVEDPNNKYLVTTPTTSPENAYKMPSGETVYVCAGSTMDNQIIRELFTNVSEAVKLLKIKEDYNWVNTLDNKKDRLAPTSIGKYGQVMEWIEDYEENEINHRHVSQLYGLHPGNELTFDKTPELMEAAKVTLNRRGDQSTGWSMAWKINFWARLQDGNRAYKLIGDLLQPAQRRGEGTYPNLFCAHPPMQIDGNFGGSAGIIEMLLQSHAGYIDLLPAIPTEWKNGSAKGLKVRGGAEIDFSWANNKLKDISLKPTVANSFVLKLPADSNPEVKGTKKYTIKDGKLEVNLKKGQKIDIIFS